MTLPPLPPISIADLPVWSVDVVRGAAGSRRLWASCLASKVVHVAAAGAIYALVSSDLVSFSPPAGKQSIELSASFAAAESAAPTFVSPAPEVPEQLELPPAPRAVPVIPKGERPPIDGAGSSPSPPEETPPSQPSEQAARRRPPETTHDAALPVLTATSLTKPPAQPSPLTSTTVLPAPAVVASQATVGTEDALPAADFCPEPVYPPALLAARIEGQVVVRLSVAADGTVVAAAIHRGSGHAAMDEAALAAVRRWKFHPARRFGSAVAVQVLKPLRFRIENP